MSTLKEVAARAGVSTSTVSNVFVGRVPVREPTKRKVLAAARRLGYRPNGPAQTLRTGRSQILGLCVPFIKNPTMASIIQGASAAAYRAGYVVVVCPLENDAALQRTYLDLLERQRVDAVITLAASDDPRPYLALQQSGTAVVFVDRQPRDIAADFVSPDHRTGTRDATRHLLDGGRRRIALLTGPARIGSSAAREAGYREAHAAAGVAVSQQWIRTVPHSVDAAYEATATLLRLPLRPDAIMAGSAGLTLGVLNCLRDRAVSVPGEIALVGAGDVEWARLVTPPLSMIEVDGEALGRRAAELALARLAAAGAGVDTAAVATQPPQAVYLPASLVVRASSAPALAPGPANGRQTEE